MMERNDWFKLDANEGVCALDAEQLARVLSPEVARRYPRADLFEADLATYYDVNPRQIIATAGADDAIERAFRALAGAGAKVLTTTPGFVEFLDAAKRAEATFLPLYKKPGSEFPIGAFCARVAAEKPALAIVATPDNPAGTTLSLTDFARVAEACRAAGTIFLLDVTYLDFADDREIFAKALATPSVLLTGSFSKSRGLAGFRVGWAMTNLGDAGTIDRLREAGPPFSLSSPAIAAARMALAECEDRYRGFVKRIGEERRLLEKALAAIGARTWPSEANFVTATVPDAAAFVAAMRKEGILIRYWPGSPEAEGLIRVTCPGEEAGFKRLRDALARMEALSWKE